MTFAVTNIFSNGTVANATEINTNFTDVENQFNNSAPESNILLQIVPIGVILPWAKSLTNVPALPTGWVECDGSVLNDATSVLNGQTIPNLNGGNKFLRGATTSGGTGGAETHDHGGVTGSKAADETTTTGEVNATRAHTHTISSASSLPTYYEVVWIMRVK